ncbi:MAG: sulfite exporter TauE/SafE family protein [Acidimicrobiales bacterium]
MSFVDGLAILAAGLAAGTINAIVGSGSLITFPTLLGLGYEPVEANVTNTVGLVPGSISGTIGYRRELAGQADRVRALSRASLLGGITGAILLLVLPGAVFEGVVPVLILVACALVVLQPRLARPAPAEGARAHSRWLPVTIYATGIYGGYFGAAQGVILIALLGIFVDDHVQRLNALKNLLAALVNGVAAVIFMVVADVAWGAAAVLAAGAIVGGQIGAKVGRRIPTPLLRVVIVVVGTAVAVKLLLD